MKRENYKKTAIRLPQYLWDDVTVIGERLGVSNNSVMVLAIGQLVEQEKKKQELMTPEAMAKVFNALNPEMVEVLKNSQSGK